MATLTKNVIRKTATPAYHALTPVSSVGADFVATGREIVVVHNENSGSTARTLTVTSTNDRQNRTRDITAYSVAAGAWAVSMRFPNVGWRASNNGKTAMNGSNAELKAFVFQLG